MQWDDPVDRAASRKRRQGSGADGFAIKSCAFVGYPGGDDGCPSESGGQCGVCVPSKASSHYDGRYPEKRRRKFVSSSRGEPNPATDLRPSHGMIKRGVARRTSITVGSLL